MPRKTRIVPLVLVLLVLVGTPLGVLLFDSAHTRQTVGQTLSRWFSRAGAGTTTGLEDVSQSILPKGSKSDFLTPQGIGDPIVEKDYPRIANVSTADVDGDGLLDVLVCDALKDRVSWIRQNPKGAFTEIPCGTTIKAPAHAQAAAIFGDTKRKDHLDIVVASLGILFPNNDKLGSVVILENDGKDNFTNRVVLDRVARVSDVRAGDLNGDGRPDLAVVQFGYDDGETRWLENKGDGTFESHLLQSLSGGVNVEIADMNGDGKPDIVTIISQEWEEIYVLTNDGKGQFTPLHVYGSSNEDFGSSGISIVDLNKDGKPDILYTNGDAFDYIPPRPRPWHGVQWLENKGDLKFEFHRIADFAGSFSARAVDFNHDGNLDIVVVSGFNTWEKPDAQSIVWLENNGKMQFAMHDIGNAPTHLITSDVGDFDGDGQTDVVTGGMHVYPPYDRLGRVTLWMNHWPTGKSNQEQGK